LIAGEIHSWPGMICIRLIKSNYRKLVTGPIRCTALYLKPDFIYLVTLAIRSLEEISSPCRTGFEIYKPGGGEETGECVG
jgi:hypothetical protein